ncbi:MAG: hypothetical protein WB567_17855, partial [Terracidiphilus sp.]
MPPSSNPPASTQKSHSSFLFLFEGLAALTLLIAVIYLFATNPSAGHWAQNYNPTGHWQISTLIAALPIVILLGAMAILRLKAHVAALAGLATALLAAIVV